VKKTGTLQSLNVSPKGYYEGFLLKSGKEIIQINWPKEHLQRFAGGWPLDSQISVDVESEEARGAPAHQVFKLIRMIGNGHQEKGQDSLLSRQFSGRVERLNYALHGEVNGAILDSGDFLHLKPEGARAVGLEVGMAVEAHGKTKLMPGGRFVIEADEVNGTAIGHHKGKKKRAR
jgi:hypothetical protein